MKNTLDRLILNTIDIGTMKKITPIKIDSKIKDWPLRLVPKREINLSSVIQNGPLILTFIRGTWCPFCNMHLRNLRSWVEKLQNKSGTIIVVSSESEADIQKWLDLNPIPYLFATDNKYELADYFGVRLPNYDFFQAATFLIDVDQTIRLAYTGKRSSKLFKKMDKAFI